MKVFSPLKEYTGMSTPTRAILPVQQEWWPTEVPVATRNIN